jgi:hypothetical protein
VTFQPPVNLNKSGAGQGCDIAVEADGDIYVTWRDFEFSSSHKNSGLSFVRSTDGGLSFSKVRKIASFPLYTPFDGARDCGDGDYECPGGFVFARIPLEPRITSDPTGELPGVFVAFNAIDPSTVEPSDTSYSSAGAGLVGRSVVWLMRTTNDGRAWSGPYRPNSVTDGHQFFPDADALAGRLAVVWQDSRVDSCYDVQLPIGNDADGTRCNAAGDVNTYVAVSTNGASFGPSVRVSSETQEIQYEMFGSRSIPFIGDYIWIQLAEQQDGSLFGYTAWTDNRDVVEGNDPREETQDGFDVHMCVEELPDGTWGPNTCPNAGGLSQNIYGNSITIP